MLDVPTVRVATGRSALGDLAGRGGGTGGVLTGGEPVTVLGAGFKNAGAALIRGGRIRSASRKVSARYTADRPRYSTD